MESLLLTLYLPNFLKYNCPASIFNLRDVYEEDLNQLSKPTV
jgi:hypothetical protein